MQIKKISKLNFSESFWGTDVIIIDISQKKYIFFLFPIDFYKEVLYNINILIIIIR